MACRCKFGESNHARTSDERGQQGAAYDEGADVLLWPKDPSRLSRELACSTPEKEVKQLATGA
jgi:hypothetical protein